MSDPKDEKAQPVAVQWAHVLDEAGSADLYDTETEARSMRDLCGGGVDRIETTVVVPFTLSTSPEPLKSSHPVEKPTGPCSSGPLVPPAPWEPHNYLGWRDGGCSCSCGRRFDSVQEYDAHLVSSPEQAASS